MKTNPDWKNPNGIPSQSPGLRGTSYLGCRVEEEHNPMIGDEKQVVVSNPLGHRFHRLRKP